MTWTPWRNVQLVRDSEPYGAHNPYLTPWIRTLGYVARDSQSTVTENLRIRIKILDPLFIDETRTKNTNNSQNMRIKRNKPHKCIDHKNRLIYRPICLFKHTKRKDNEKLKIRKYLILTKKKKIYLIPKDLIITNPNNYK